MQLAPTERQIGMLTWQVSTARNLYPEVLAMFPPVRIKHIDAAIMLMERYARQLPRGQIQAILGLFQRDMRIEACSALARAITQIKAK